MLTLLTTTGARNEAFLICQRLMLAQEVNERVRWVIVDDGETPQDINFKREGWQLHVVRPKPYWRMGENTQARNLQIGLSTVDVKDQLIIIEDDDYYSPKWLHYASNTLREADIMGEYRARYYNVRTRRYRHLGNTQHASLCCTAVKGKALDALREACKARTKFIDIELWRSTAALRRVLIESRYTVGIKGLPGRGGIGIGHADEFGAPDPNGTIFRDWLKEDARYYA